MADRSETYFAAYRRRLPEQDSTGLPDGLIIGPAEIRDTAGLAALHQEREGGIYAEHQERFYKEITDNPDWQHRLAPANSAPPGWYLAGVIVTPAFRRRGIGAELPRRRLEWIKARAEEAFFFVNAQNRASIDLHTALGFEEITRDFFYAGVIFTGGVGILYRADLKIPRS